MLCCVNRIRIWSPRRDERSSVLIGVSGTRRPDWPERVKAGDFRARGDR